jgi:hypothetical protein
MSGTTRVLVSDDSSRLNNPGDTTYLIQDDRNSN